MGVATGMAPYRVRLTARNDALTAGTSDAIFLFVAPFTGSVTSVSYIPKANITGANTNTRRLRVYNRKNDGAGTTVVAELQFDSGVNATAKVPKPLTLSATLANRDFVAGDVLEFASDAVGTGLADPGGTVVLEVQRD